MNYISHYYCLPNKTSYTVLGVLLPDIFHRFSYWHNKKFLSTDTETLIPSELELWQGIEQHYSDDAYFHNMPSFKEGMRFIEGEMAKSLVLVSLKRKFMVSHILYELILDHLVLARFPNITQDIYSNLEKIDTRIVEQFFRKIIGENQEIEVFLGSFAFFMQRRFLNFYSEPANLVKSLHIVTGTISQWDYNELTISEFSTIIEKTKKRIDFDTIFSQIKSHSPL